MSAGESARTRAAELRAEADAFERGAIGEERVGAVLDSADRGSFRVLHDRLLDHAAGSKANLDHIVVAESGIYLIDAKNWVGQTSVYQNSLRQLFSTAAGRQSVSKTQEVKKISGMAAKMGRMAGRSVTPVLCLAGDGAEKFGPPAMVDDVHIVPVSGLLEWLAGRPARHHSTDLVSQAVQLSCQFPPAVGGALTLAPTETSTARSTRRHAVARSGARSADHRVRRLVPLAVLVIAALVAGPRLLAYGAHHAEQLLPSAGAQPPASPTTARSILSGAQAQALDDWRIRAGLYESNAKPATLPYVADANLGSESSVCRTQSERLDPFRPGLLEAPDRQLAAAAKAYDSATRALLDACIANHPVALHHAEGAVSVAASRVNLRYARLLGQDPSSVYTKHVL